MAAGRQSPPARIQGGRHEMSKEQPIDVRDMAVIHRTFRAGYTESARLVRAAPAPSPGRVGFLANHIDFSIAMLHVHHEGEDELLYPKLIERVPDQAPMTEQVDHEHLLIKTALDEASPPAPPGAGRPPPGPAGPRAARPGPPTASSQ